jgi:uncharacterized repeat protein (TIGR01451 family)
MKTIKNFGYKSMVCLIATLALFTPNVYAIKDSDLVWSSTISTYQMIPTNNMVTEGNYTIKAIEFPAPVRGGMNINGSIVPLNPVVPAVKFELYYDIINNPKPIDTFAFGVGDYYITKDQNFKISLNDIPGELSQDWVYEYYNPWVSINIQKRAVPTLDIAITLEDSAGDALNESDIKTGDIFRIIVDIKNTGEDIIKNVNYNIDIGNMTLRSVSGSGKLKDSVYQLNVNEIKTVDINVMAPISIDPSDDDIQVNATGNDIKDIMYEFGNDHPFSVQGAIDSISVYKQALKTTYYMKEPVHVTLNVVNTGPIDINGVQLHDAVPEELQLLENNSLRDIRELSYNKSSVGSDSSWNIEYILESMAPGIYILPASSINFSMQGRKFTMTTAEVGFRIFGPVLLLNKSVTDTGNGLEITVTASNIGNGFASRVSIEDQLPQDATIISGDVNLTTSLDVGVEKSMSYVINMPKSENISAIIWPPAKATYYLDDYKFNTSSDKKIVEGTFDVGRSPEGGTNIHEVLVPITVVTTYPTATIPKITETEKEVVATIPASTPIQTPEKSVPGFESYESLFCIFMIVILSGFLLKNKKH